MILGLGEVDFGAVGVHGRVLDDAVGVDGGVDVAAEVRCDADTSRALWAFVAARLRACVRHRDVGQRSARFRAADPDGDTAASFERRLAHLGDRSRLRRARDDNRLRGLPVLVLMPHSRCNCRCIMCDIWRANANGLELGADDFTPHLESFKNLRVRCVVLSGGEPLASFADA
jgi:hypothetical protein